MADLEHADAALTQGLWGAPKCSSHANGCETSPAALA